jgi:UDP-N-acetylglucosamine 2-epimerase
MIDNSTTISERRLVSVIGARPQFIKAAPVSRALRAEGFSEILIHTGQHYDENMSTIFFDELNIPEPDTDLGIGSGPHGWQTGQMLIGIEKVLQREKPAWVLVYGDTNSTLAGTLAAIKLHIPVAHIEAGLRSFNRSMPEEHNRVLTDHAADLLLCPTQTAVDNLAREGITAGVHVVGDVMYDAVQYNADLARQRSDVMDHMHLRSQDYILVTVHRPRNTDNTARLLSILQALEAIGRETPIVLPAHPRTRQAIEMLDYQPGPHIHLTEPVGYLDMLMLEQNARLIITDSGGVQKEAYFFAVPCLTLREETEWVETVESGWNRLVGADQATIIEAARTFEPTGSPPPVFGDGHASEHIAALLRRACGS